MSGLAHFQDVNKMKGWRERISGVGSLGKLLISHVVAPMSFWHSNLYKYTLCTINDLDFAHHKLLIILMNLILLNFLFG